MLFLVKPGEYEIYRQDLNNMYRLRHKVLFEKLKWDLVCQEDMERDELDENNMYYLIYKDHIGKIRGCIRFVEMINECMFDSFYIDALPIVNEFKKRGYWETSRFLVDISSDDYYQPEMQGRVSKLLLSGLMKFGLDTHKVKGYITVTCPSVKRLTKQNGLFLYDMGTTIFAKEKNCVWMYPPMSYSYEKLTKNLKENFVKSLMFYEFSNESSYTGYLH